MPGFSCLWASKCPLAPWVTAAGAGAAARRSRGVVSRAPVVTEPARSEAASDVWRSLKGWRAAFAASARETPSDAPHVKSAPCRTNCGRHRRRTSRTRRNAERDTYCGFGAASHAGHLPSPGQRPDHQHNADTLQRHGVPPVLRRLCDTTIRRKSLAQRSWVASRRPRLARLRRHLARTTMRTGSGFIWRQGHSDQLQRRGAEGGWRGLGANRTRSTSRCWTRPLS
mmetsp:Transcript_31872/g.81605  ORF Transcript_31872/g.81605 Transcript_31872/m.81605 type:complete len:226 (+) Transcript_31872:516-1193(+)